MTTTNSYFNNFPANITREQLLIEDLCIESMKINGMTTFYMPRSSGDKVDYLFGEDQLKQFVNAYPIEMYLENVSGMDGLGDFISKFGYEVRDEIGLLVSRRRFVATVPQIRPNEGDLVYIPLFRSFFEITFVEHENAQAMFYTLGRGRGANVYVFALKLNQFVFSNEYIKTGIEELDSQVRDNYKKIRLVCTNINGTFNKDEVLYQGPSYELRTNEALFFSLSNNNLDVYKNSGKFVTGRIYGVESGSYADITIVDELSIMDEAFEDIQDNNRVQDEFDIIGDWSEQNPFGSLEDPTP